MNPVISAEQADAALMSGEELYDTGNACLRSDGTCCVMIVPSERATLVTVSISSCDNAAEICCSPERNWRISVSTKARCDGESRTRVRVSLSS